MQSPVNVLLPTVKEHAAVATGTQSDHFNDKTTAYGASECQETERAMQAYVSYVIRLFIFNENLLVHTGRLT